MVEIAESKGVNRDVPEHVRARSAAGLSERDWVAVILTFAVILLFGAIKAWYSTLVSLGSNYLFLPLGLAFLLSLTFWRVRYEGLSPAFSIVLKGIAASVGFYAFVAWPSFDANTHPEMSSTVLALEISRILVCACAIVSMSRPSFALSVCTYVIVAKDLSEAILGLPSLSRTDYLPVIEAGIFLSLVAILYCLASSLSKSNASSAKLSALLGDPATRNRVSLVAFFLTVSFHFGNYFYSAVQKLILDGGPLDWVVNNNTALLILVTREAWALPLGHWPEFSMRLFELFSAIYSFSNAIVLFGQVICIVAIWRVAWAMWLTVFYDLTHLLIFVLTGIFFWKWILLNLFIVLAFSSIRHFSVPHWLKGLSSLAIVFGTLVFFAARLGWYDTNAFVNHYFIAETEDGVMARVPSNYFLTGSVTVAQQRLGTISHDHFPVATWATTQRSSIRQSAENSCGFGSAGVVPRYEGNIESLARYVRRHHKFVLSQLDANGRFSFDWYPHHIFSNPILSRDFHALNKSAIRKYIYVVESVCLGSDQGELLKEVRMRHEYEIPVVEL